MKMKIRFRLASPCFRAWRRWRIIKEIKEAEHITNAIIGYKKYSKDFRYISIYFFPIFFIKIYY